MNFTEEQILQAHERAPKVIQDALTDGPAVDFLLSVRSRYGLHVDVAGKVIDVTRNMILGLVPPTEFIPLLASFGVAEATARQITTDLNKEVFVPLRDAVREGSHAEEASQPDPKPVSAPLVPPLKVEASAPPAAVTKDSVPAFNLVHSQTVSSVPNVIPPSPALSHPASVQPSMSGVLLHSMASDMAHIKDGTYAVQAPAPLTQTMQPEHATPARSFQTASIPVLFSEPIIRPSPAGPIPAPPIQPPPLAQSDLAPSNTSASKEYSADPYRETF